MILVLNCNDYYNLILQETALEETPIAVNFDLGPKSQIDLTATEEFKFMTGVYKHKPSPNRRRREMQQAAQIRNRINKMRSKKHKVKVSKDATAPNMQ